jgi:hypothetical protein
VIVGLLCIELGDDLPAAKGKEEVKEVWQVTPTARVTSNSFWFEARENYSHLKNLSIENTTESGRRNKHGMPLRRLLIFGPSGLAEVRGWVKDWLKK